jgi:nicotinamide phosphoribosyltransferase
VSINIILNTDSYKISHWKQYPPNTKFVSSYIEARGGEIKEVVFFGLQMFIEQYLTKPVTRANIDEAKEVLAAHGVPFNEKGWLYILKKYKGYLPISIEAVPEGMVVPTNNILVQVVNTDPKCAWVTSYIETALLRAVWYPVTVATRSREVKKIIKRYLEETGTPDDVYFKLHDFGARGVSSFESAEIGGLAHLVNFKGTDTLSAIMAARKYYDENMAGFSIPAAEHSTITCWGKENESKAYANMIKQFSGENKLVAVVSDSYDIFNACENIWGDELKDEVINNGGTVIVRPDSGDPVEVVQEVIELLMKQFGYGTNSKGYRVLPSYIRVIQGDGVNLKYIEDILETLKKNNISADNIAFGMGGELLQRLDRDTHKFAMKASYARINDRDIEVYKDPVTDKGKRSKKGQLALVEEDGEIRTVSMRKGLMKNMLVPIFKNGVVLKRYSLEAIRNLAKI